MITRKNETNQTENIPHKKEAKQLLLKLLALRFLPKQLSTWTNLVPAASLSATEVSHY